MVLMSASHTFGPLRSVTEACIRNVLWSMACVLFWAGTMLSAQACDAAGDLEASVPVRVLAPTNEGHLLLEDGRLFMPKGIILPSRLYPEPELIRASGVAISSVFENSALRLTQTSLDRHGHLTGHAILDNQEDAVLALLREGAGYAQTLPAPRSRTRPSNKASLSCNSLYKEAEEKARQAKRGIWSTPGAVIKATDETALAAHVGLHTVVEGRVTATGTTREWIYLNFGSRWSEDFTILVAPRDFVPIFGNGLDPAMLQGTVMRVRGVVREEGGPAIFARTAEDVTWVTRANEEQNER